MTSSIDFMFTIIAIGFILKSSDDDLQSYKNNTNKYKKQLNKL